MVLGVNDFVAHDARQLRGAFHAVEKPRIDVDRPAGNGKRVERGIGDDEEAILERLRTHYREQSPADLIDESFDFRIGDERELLFRLAAELPADARLVILLDRVRRRREFAGRNVRAADDQRNRQQMRTAVKHRMIIVSVRGGSNSAVLDGKMRKSYFSTRAILHYVRSCMAYETFIYEVEDGIATVRLNDPKTLNALTFKTYEELERLTRELVDDAAVQVLVITGDGKGFCSGGSLHDIIAKLIEMKGDSLYRFTRMTCDVVKNMRALKKPIIAAVNGIAAGAGAMLALASDFRIVSTSARFAFLFVKVGLAGADMGAIHLLPRIVGQGRATELLMLGEAVDAQEAWRIGLANRVVRHEELLDEAYAFARKLKEGPLYAMGVTKQLINREMQMELEAA